MLTLMYQSRNRTPHVLLRLGYKTALWGSLANLIFSLFCNVFLIFSNYSGRLLSVDPILMNAQFACFEIYFYFNLESEN